MACPFPRPTLDQLCVCWTDTTPLTTREAAQWVTTLPDVEQHRFAQFKHARTAHEFLVGRLLVRRWLSELTGSRPHEWHFADGFRGRPEVASPPTSFRFNLAHSGGVVACIISDGREVGIDVEDLTRRPVEQDLWHRYCAPEEIADIEAQPPDKRHQRFLSYWTLKEAYLKARGLGIGVHLADIAFTIDRDAPAIHFRRSLAGTSTAWVFGMTSVNTHHLLSWATPHHPGTPTPSATVTGLALADVVPDA